MIKGQKTRSYARSLGRVDMFAPVGSDDITFIDNQPPPVTHFVIYFAGTGPESGVTDVSAARLIQVDVNTAFRLIAPLLETTGGQPLER